jgi:uncharacterized protein YdhG (YjbR/CyaY superfamily)
MTLSENKNEEITSKINGGYRQIEINRNLKNKIEPVMDRPKDIDDYIKGFPKEVQLFLEQVRSTIKRSAPEAKEVISYGMPAFKMNGILVWFAGHAKHVGFYPKASGIEAFKNELTIYKWAKGSVQFPLDKPMPLELISRIVEFRVNENLRNSEKI